MTSGVPFPDLSRTGMRTRHVVIDSRDRDTAVWPTPSRYDVRLEEEIIDAVSIKLLVADVPFSAYVVGPANDAVPVSVAGGALTTVRLPHGDATGAALAAALKGALDQQAAAGAPWTVSFDASTERYAVSTAAGAFALPFAAAGAGGMAGMAGTGTAARVLGFSPRVDYSSAAGAGGAHVLGSPFRADTWSDRRYIVLRLGPAEVVSSDREPLHRSFALLPNRRAGGDPCVEACDCSTERTWAPPVGRLARLSVEFTDSEGRPYDFQNHEHRLELLVTFDPERRCQFR